MLSVIIYWRIIHVYMYAADPLTTSVYLIDYINVVFQDFYKPR